MNFNNTDAYELLASRAGDYLSMSERGELVCGNFLTPSEAAYTLSVLKSKRASDRAFLFGGYEDAERKRIFVLPSYLSDFDGTPSEIAEQYFKDDLADAVKAIKIQGSGYRELSHRDYLGSILSLGIERSAIGDIVVLDKRSAIIFCTDKIFGFLLTSLENVASDKVTLSETTVSEGVLPKREFKPISDTVASNRLDCIVASLTNLSREKAQTLIKSGLCEVDYMPEGRVDVSLKVPCTVTLRGYGKFNVLSFDGETKRGRLRLAAQKYV